MSFLAGFVEALGDDAADRRKRSRDLEAKKIQREDDKLMFDFEQSRRYNDALKLQEYKDERDNKKYSKFAKELAALSGNADDPEVEGHWYSSLQAGMSAKDLREQALNSNRGSWNTAKTRAAAAGTQVGTQVGTGLTNNTDLNTETDAMINDSSLSPSLTAEQIADPSELESAKKQGENAKVISDATGEDPVKVLERTTGSNTVNNESLLDPELANDVVQSNDRLYTPPVDTSPYKKNLSPENVDNLILNARVDMESDGPNKAAATKAYYELSRFKKIAGVPVGEDDFKPMFASFEQVSENGEKAIKWKQVWVNSTHVRLNSKTDSESLGVTDEDMKEVRNGTIPKALLNPSVTYSESGDNYSPQEVKDWRAETKAFREKRSATVAAIGKLDEYKELVSNNPQVTTLLAKGWASVRSGIREIAGVDRVFTDFGGEATPAQIRDGTIANISNATGIDEGQRKLAYIQEEIIYEYLRSQGLSGNNMTNQKYESARRSIFESSPERIDDQVGFIIQNMKRSLQQEASSVGSGGIGKPGAQGLELKDLGLNQMLFNEGLSDYAEGRVQTDKSSNGKVIKGEISVMSDNPPALEDLDSTRKPEIIWSPDGRKHLRYFLKESGTVIVPVNKE